MRADQASIIRFNRICQLAALVVLTAGVVVPRLLQPSARGDFGQFYMAGLIVRTGAWDALYPIARSGSVNNPGAPENSTMRPRYAQLAEASGVGDTVRFMQPPPIALFYLPLALLSCQHAYYIWLTVMLFCMWGVAIHAGKIFEMTCGQQSRRAGLLTLLIAISPLAYRTLRTAHPSPMLSLLMSLAAIDLLRRGSIKSAAAIVVATATKYVGLALLPVALALRRWSVIVWIAALGAGWIGLSLLVMGFEPFRTFSRDIAPLLARPHPWHGNQSLPGLLVRITGEIPLAHPVETALRIVQTLSLGALVVLMFRRPRGSWLPQHVFAAASALIAWMLIFSPIYWEHYAVYLCPFWGWLLWEATQSRLRAGLVTIIIAGLWLPLVLFQRQILPEPLNSHMLLAAMLMMGIGAARLINIQTHRSPSPPGDSARYSTAIPPP